MQSVTDLLVLIQSMVVICFASEVRGKATGFRKFFAKNIINMKTRSSFINRICGAVGWHVGLLKVIVAGFESLRGHLFSKVRKDNF